MATAWRIVKKDRFGNLIETIEFYGNRMTTEILDNHYGKDLISIEQLDPQIAFKKRNKVRVLKR